MPLIHALPEATTTPGTPRPSASVSYNGTSDRSVIIKPICSTWLTANPAIVMTVEVQQSFDNGNTWEDFSRIDISPPQLNRHGEIPYLGCQVVDNLGPRLARILLSVTNASLACGVDITV